MIKKFMVPLTILLLLAVIILMKIKGSLDIIYNGENLIAYSKYDKGYNYVITELKLPQIDIDTAKFSLGDSILFDESTHYLNKNNMWYITNNKKEVEELLGNRSLLGLREGDSILILLDRKDSYSYIETEGNKYNGIYLKEYIFFSTTDDPRAMNQNINSILISKQKQLVTHENIAGKDFLIISSEDFTNVYSISNDMCYIFSFSDGDKEKVVNCLKKITEVQIENKHK